MQFLIFFCIHRIIHHEFTYPWNSHFRWINPRKLMPTNIDKTQVTMISNYSNYLPCWVPPDEPTELPPGLCPPDVPADWVSIIVWVRIPPPEEWPEPWLPPDGADVVLEVTTGLTVVVVVVVVGFGVVVRSVGEEGQNLSKLTQQLSKFWRKKFFIFRVKNSL